MLWIYLVLELLAMLALALALARNVSVVDFLTDYPGVEASNLGYDWI